MEQWHQKLHNNTTPDDVAICEAYLNFLAGGGDAGAYWATLSDAGIVSFFFFHIFFFDFDIDGRKKKGEKLTRFSFFLLLLSSNKKLSRTARGSSRSIGQSPASPRTSRTRGRGFRRT